MGKWEKLEDLEPIYKQIVKEGFILTQGQLALSFENPFGNMSLRYPSFQLLNVHRGHPIEIKDSKGRFSISPYKDKRLPGEFTKDPNPNVYDAATFFLAPFNLQLKPNYPGKMNLVDGFITENNSRTLASLVYIGERWFNIDNQGTQTVSVITPSQIPAHFNYWLYHAGRAQGYEPHQWKDIGRFDLTDTAKTAQKAALELERRFKTKIL